MGNTPNPAILNQSLHNPNYFRATRDWNEDENESNEWDHNLGQMM
jgi:hypothetical protein